MKAAVYLGKEQIVVQEVALPTLEEGEILLAIDSCSVCGTDLRTYRHGDAKIKPPRILGHEFCGRVVESRAQNANVKIGDRVVMYIVLIHETDKYVEMGRANLSGNRTTMSYHHDGAFAPFMKVPALAVKQGNLFKVETDIPSDHLSLAEPLGCCMNANSRLGVGLKDTVAVLGAGPIGIALHGSSGLPEADLLAAVQAGVAKVNWSSESLLIRSQAAQAYYADHTAELDKKHKAWKSTAMDNGVQTAIAECYVPKVMERIRLLGGAGQASRFLNHLP